MWQLSLPRVLVWLAAAGWGFYASLGTTLAADPAEWLGRGAVPFLVTWLALGFLLPSIPSTGWSIVELFVITGCVVLIAFAWLMASGSLANVHRWGASILLMTLLFVTYVSVVACTLLCGTFARSAVRWANSR